MPAQATPGFCCLGESGFFPPQNFKKGLLLSVLGWLCLALHTSYAAATLSPSAVISLLNILT